MWRLIFVFCLLPTSIVFAGESRSLMQVGITITGNGKGSMVRPTPAAGATGQMQVLVPLPTKRPAATGHRDTVNGR